MISALDFSPDGKRLVTGGFSELTAAHPVKIILWDLASSKPVSSFDAPRQVTSAVFSPDGQWIATACRDKSVAVHPAT
ncbi:MAG: PD40 domain-containing protein [Bryobacterales bacterium]|nr:PD40 domain-containing protein [Bryobacterales bacterium]